jgi:hypothetical protein
MEKTLTLLGLCPEFLRALLEVTETEELPEEEPLDVQMVADAREALKVAEEDDPMLMANLADRAKKIQKLYDAEHPTDFTEEPRDFRVEHPYLTLVQSGAAVLLALLGIMMGIKIFG